MLPSTLVGAASEQHFQPNWDRQLLATSKPNVDETFYLQRLHCNVSISAWVVSAPLWRISVIAWVQENVWDKVQSNIEGVNMQIHQLRNEQHSTTAKVVLNDLVILFTATVWFHKLSFQDSAWNKVQGCSFSEIRNLSLFKERNNYFIEGCEA